MTNPKDIRTDHYFMGSVFGNSECETILRNILLMQKNQNPDNWQPFTWEQYKAFCSHSVTESERGVLQAFVNGGKPVWNTSAYLTPGWLAFDEKTGHYSFTEQMIAMLAESWPEKDLQFSE